MSYDFWSDLVRSDITLKNVDIIQYVDLESIPMKLMAMMVCNIIKVGQGH